MPSTKTIVIVGACAAVAVAAFVYVRAKKAGPSRSLWSGGLNLRAAQEIAAHPSTRSGRGHF